MSLTDPIADMLTQIRNAGNVRRVEVLVPASKVCLGIAGVLKEEGFILDFDRIDDANKQGRIRIRLKYTLSGEHAIQHLKRVSKPGCRTYKGVDELPRVVGGLGIAIVTTSRGIMSDKKCRQQKIGGEMICTVS